MLDGVPVSTAISSRKSVLGDERCSLAEEERRNSVVDHVTDAAHTGGTYPIRRGKVTWPFAEGPDG